MANTLTGLIPTLYEALDTVSRELVGLIPSVWRNPEGRNMERAAVDQVVTFPITQSQSTADNTPGVTAPDTGDQTVDTGSISISKSKHVAIRWNGEEQQALRTGDTSRLNGILNDQFQQAFRTLTNEMEADLAAKYTKASRAYGIAGTTPFGSSLAEAAQIKKILDDNGAPGMDRSLVVNTTAGANLRELANLNQVNTSGTDVTLRSGILLPLMGLNIRESAQIKAHTAGTATGFDANGGEPIGETTLVVDGSDSGTILAGDVVTWAGDTNKYIVQSATASGAATGNIVIAKPGMIEALATTVEGTLGAAYTANMAFQKQAFAMITRLPALPDGGDMATDRTIIVDPLTGIAFEVSVYKQYKQIHIEIAAAWGQEVVKPAHTALLLG